MNFSIKADLTSNGFKLNLAASCAYMYVIHLRDDVLGVSH